MAGCCLAQSPPAGLGAASAQLRRRRLREASGLKRRRPGPHLPRPRRHPASRQAGAQHRRAPPDEQDRDRRRQDRGRPDRAGEAGRRAQGCPGVREGRAGRHRRPAARGARAAQGLAAVAEQLRVAHLHAVPGPQVDRETPAGHHQAGRGGRRAVDAQLGHSPAPADAAGWRKETLALALAQGGRRPEEQAQVAAAGDGKGFGQQ
mmetsp:Transcript_38233/g.96074  ORF Transcript_38233/g.96074 Transcript_38233/m.96074 type:complete len:205 (-) Transcript_38233:2234-2848(-)